jgi:hypothetical protein
VIVDAIVLVVALLLMAGGLWLLWNVAVGAWKDSRR